AIAKGPLGRTERRSLALGRRCPWILPVVVDMLLATPGQGTYPVILVWLADDVQLGEDIAADRAAPVPSARGHPVVAAGGADSKEPAGRGRTILGRRGFRWE